ncbi:MAG: S41 family peptidase [Sporocytophaga sp.]|uniref:S41 family peptidase n=1 Tax=Sporocytophaga sp. TaxID=2231183 RepID=UPI001B236B76|nr:S41 family peptidase [Sporocytophaga sp.]MBO9703453.1 S41 family peptidase [Sporocytophaga sp.]
MKKNVKKIAFFIVLIASVTLVAFNRPDDKYFEIAKNIDIFASLFKEVNAYYVDEVNPNQVMKKGIDAMLESLDPYTNYIPEDEIEDFRTMTTGQYGGIGAVIGKRNERPIILMPYEGFPAHKAGLMVGDEIVSVDGIEVTSKATSDISKLLKGQSNTQVKVVVKRLGTPDKFEVVLTREKIKIDNVPYYGMVNNNTGYIKLSDFTSNASKEVKKALVELKEKGAKNIILDLRDNPGGLLSEAINISNLFIAKDKEIVRTKGKISEWNKIYNALNAPVDTEMPLVVLTSSRSASASEIVSGVIQDYDRGVLIGERTYGKGLVQATRPLTYNSQLKITTAKYYTPSGRCIQAIDYSHRNEDGSVGKIPDSLRVAFKTKNGRTVYDGGGISPDIEVEDRTIAPITSSLISKGLLFDYAGAYVLDHKKIKGAKEYEMTDAEYQDFIKWLANKEYDYSTKVENTLEDLVNFSKKEKYYDAIKPQVESLKAQISHNKEKDLMTFKDEIKEYLEEEIVSRFYLQKGVVEASFDDDEDVTAAIKIFNNPAEFNKLLQGK